MSFSSKRYQVVVGAGFLALSASAARADQFTFFDFTYEATVAATHDAHYDVKAPKHELTQPNSWKTPIDYTAGTIYIEQDVMTKPSMEPTQVDVCFLTGGYGCLNTMLYTTTGRHTTTAPTKSFWNFGNINWGAKIPLVQLIVKDKNNANGGRPVSNFMPTKMRIALTVVAPGSTYVPPPGFASAAPDAGTPDATPDAEPPGTGGSSGAGTGGASGTGTGGTPSAGSGGASNAGTGGASSVGTGGSSSAGTGGTPRATGGTSGSNPPAPTGGNQIGNPACSYGSSSTPAPLVAFALALVALLSRRRR